MRKLASIQKVAELFEINDKNGKAAENIQGARILGWECVVKRGEFKEDDLCVYFEVDSILPPWEQFEFMEKRKYRVKTARFLQQTAQGLALPLTAFPVQLADTFKEGDDVSELLEIVKYDPELKDEKALEAEAAKHGRTYKYFLRYKWFRKFVTKKKGGWPSFIPKTDEDRIQSRPSYLRRFKDSLFYRTEKLDGQSATYAIKYKKFLGIQYNPTFLVCSRNIHLKKPQANNYWTIFQTKNIKSKLKKLKGNYAIQGEIVGPGIQKNKYGLKELDFYCFSIYNIDKKEYVTPSKLQEICGKINLQTVPLRDRVLLPETVQEIVELSQCGSTIAQTKQEGDVWRLATDSKVSFKCVNPTFLLKHNE